MTVLERVERNLHLYTVVVLNSDVTIQQVQ